MSAFRGFAQLSGLKRFTRIFWPHVLKQRKLIGIGLGGLLASTLMRILEPWPLKFVIDRITQSDPDAARVSIDAINQLDDFTLLWIAAFALVAFAALRAGMSYAGTIGFALAGNRALTEIRGELFQHLQGLSLRFHEQSRGGDIVIRMVGDIGMVKEITVTAILPLLANVFVLLGMFAVMFWLDPQLATIAAACLPLLMVATYKRGRKIRTAAKQTRKREGALAATASESFGAIRTVQSLGLGKRFAGNFSKQNAASLSEGVKVKRLSAGLERGVDIVIAVATAAVMWVGASQVMATKLSVGELMVFLFYLKGAFRPARDFAKYGARLAKASAAADRIVELFESSSDVQESPDAQTLTVLDGRIVFENVCFSYRGHVPTLDSVNFSVEAGAHVAIIGPSGSGKSTLTALLLRLYDPEQGRISIDGIDIRQFSLESLRNNIGTVLQDSVLFAGTIRENITFGLDEVSDERIESAARLANAHDFISNLPEGYDTYVGERGATLSNGQRQRIAIARAAIRDTPLLVLDEPTSGLDRRNETLVLEALMRLSAGRTTLHVTHRPDAAMQADRILVVRDGVLIEQGTHAELLANGLYYTALLATLAQSVDHNAQ